MEQISGNHSPLIESEDVDVDEVVMASAREEESSQELALAQDGPLGPRDPLRPRLHLPLATSFLSLIIKLHLEYLSIYQVQPKYSKPHSTLHFMISSPFPSSAL